MMKTKLDKEGFATLMKIAMKGNSIRAVARDLGLGHMVIWRALNNEKVELEAFVVLLDYIHANTRFSYDSICARIMEKYD